MDVKKLEAEIESLGEFSGVIELREEGKLLYQKVSGLADIANARPIRADTRFGIASGSKALTAAAVCLLAERGTLGLDDSLASWLGEACPPLDGSARLVELLSHTSGLPDYFDEEEDDDFGELWLKTPCYAMRRPIDFLPLITAAPPHPECKGSFRYNNGAYVLLALIVERASGKSFARFVEEEILRPLGMADSGYFAQDRLPGNCALGYEEDDEGLRSNVFAIPAVGGGDGGLYTTAADMGRFWDGFLGGRLLDPQMLSLMLEPRIHVENDVFYGLGLWIIRQDRGILKYFLTGGDPGLCFYSAAYPSRKRDVSFLSNRDFDDFPMSMALERAILG